MGGFVVNKNTNKVIKGDLNSSGYPRVTLYDGERKERFFRHRLVAELFVPNPYNLPEVNHKNSNKIDCLYTNLEYCDRTYNEREARRIGLKEYKPFKVIYENGDIEYYEFKSQLAEKLNVSNRTIKNYLEDTSINYKKKGILEIDYIK